MTQESAEIADDAVMIVPDTGTTPVDDAEAGLFAERGPPAWLRLLGLASAVGVLTFGTVGLILAVNGWYRPALAFPIGALAWIAVLVVARPAFSTTTAPTRAGHSYAAIGIVAILAITAWNASHASQHVLINRDGGDYANAARWIARDGSLSVKPQVGGFKDASGLDFDSFGVYQVKNGTLQFQFAHLLPVVLAEAFAISGNSGLFHAPELLGGLALLAFYLLAWRLFRRPLFALSAMLALAFIIPQVAFTRDSYSEIPSQILLFTALWLLVSSRSLPSWRVTLTAGLLLGALEEVRIDAVVFLIGVPFLLAIVWLRANGKEDRGALLASIGAFVAGLVPGFAVGLVDLTRHSGLYFHDLSHNVRLLTLLAAAAALGCAFLVAIWPRVARPVANLPWRALATAAGVLVAFTGFFAWFVRPHVQHLHSASIGLVGGLQALEHVSVDPTRNYFERSMVWMSWYLGPLTVAVAIIGAAFLARELLLGRYARATVVLVLLAPDAALYLYKASALPDHVWVTRRFLPSAFPLLVLLALGFAAAVVGRRFAPRVNVVARVGAVIVAIVAVAYPIYTLRNVASMSEQRGFINVVNDACATVGPHAAVVVLELGPNDLFDDWVPQALRSWCGAEVAVARPAPKADSLSGLARAWSSQGRTLFVVGKTSAAITGVIPGAAIHSTPVIVNGDFLAQTLTHRPGSYVRQKFSMAVARVPTE